jgi:hypothetical protein
MALDDVGLIQGKSASDIEYRVAISLDKFHWTYTFQAGIMGGRQVRGGQVIDFLVDTMPLPTPLYIFGEYFHSGKEAERDKLMMALLASAFHGSLAPPEALWGDQLETQDEADQEVLKLFGRSQ